MIDVSVEFEYECLRCYGRSRYLQEDCEQCFKTGLVPSELGEKLLEFLEHERAREAGRDVVEQGKESR